MDLYIIYLYIIYLYMFALSIYIYIHSVCPNYIKYTCIYIYIYLECHVYVFIYIYCVYRPFQCWVLAADTSGTDLESTSKCQCLFVELCTTNLVSSCCSLSRCCYPHSHLFYHSSCCPVNSTLEVKRWATVLGNDIYIYI